MKKNAVLLLAAVCIVIVLLLGVYYVQNMITPKIPNPAWVTELITQESKSANTTSIIRCSYANKTVYYIPPKYADIPSILYDAAGKEICSPDGGLTGKGDGKCSDFFETRSNCTTIWRK